ncbi:MAG: glycosyltransferase family 1 protein [Bacteriovoracaceae bacterium]
MNSLCDSSDLVVFSHLRWDFVFQRPQHLLTRHAKYRRVFYFEEPVFGMTEIPRIHIRESIEEVNIIIPYLPSNIKADEIEVALKDLVDELIYEEDIKDYTLWYYTPMALAFTQHLRPKATIFDCMDELSLFKNAPKKLIEMEKLLMKKAQLVFTGGHSLYEAKKNHHHNIHPFPSSIEYEHFAQGRLKLIEPEDQIEIPHPRVGFYGVIDERFDSELLEEMASIRKDLQFIIIGPVAKIEESSLPRKDNIHYFGKKEYHSLPLYLSGWDCAMMPFKLNDATRFISPTKTPEYLAAGRPVVSTAIKDVIYPYQNEKLVHIAYGASEFISSIEDAIFESKDPNWIRRIDSFLQLNSWDKTFEKMASLEKKLHQNENIGILPQVEEFISGGII